MGYIDKDVAEIEIVKIKSDELSKAKILKKYEEIKVGQEVEYYAE